MNLKTLLPGSTSVNGQPTTLGVMGGGQLGRMFVQAAQAMGYVTVVLDPDPASPAGLVSHHHIRTAYDDEQGLAQLMQRCDAITTEFENVPAPALVTRGAHRPVAPGADAVAIAQDRAAEKAHFVGCGVPVAPHAVIAKAEQTGDKSNPRFVVTTLPGDARQLYEVVYCARGDMENRIKECQLDLFADRTSAATMRANQLRLWFASMA